MKAYVSKLASNRARKQLLLAAAALVLVGSGASIAVAANAGDNTQLVPGLTARRAELSPTDLDSIGVTLNRFALGVDQPDADILASTFTTDGLFTARRGAQLPFASVRGRDSIVTFLVHTRQTQGYPERHFITNVSAERGPGANATVHAYLLLTHVSNGIVSTDQEETINVAMTRDSQGIWLITEFDVVLDSN